MSNNIELSRLEAVKLAYIGSSRQMIERLLASDKFVLAAVIIERKRMTEEIRAFLADNNIRCCPVSDKSELSAAFELIGAEYYVMYGFGIIIPEELTLAHNIFNIHPGSLLTNRGAQPVVWSVLRGEKRTCLSLHKIAVQIDSGLLICEYWVDILETDDTLSLNEKLAVGFNYVLEELYHFICGRRRGTLVQGGQYRPRIQRRDFTINIEKDSIESIKRKIRSQKAYQGALLEINGLRFYVTEVERIES